MKKFYLLFASLVMLMTSCQTQFGLVYNVDLNAHGDGICEVSYPSNPEVSLKMLGRVEGIEFHIGDTVPFGQVMTKQEVLEKGDKEEMEAMYKVNEALTKQFYVNALDTAGGHYYVHIEGYVKEMGTGFIFAIDRTFTNEQQLRKAAGQEPLFLDAYPFIK